MDGAGLARHQAFLGYFKTAVEAAIAYAKSYESGEPRLRSEPDQTPDCDPNCNAWSELLQNK